MTSGPLVIRSEFALVEVSLVRRGTGDVLRIADVPGGTEVCLDALELEALCAFGPELRARLQNPEWRMADQRKDEDPA